MLNLFKQRDIGVMLVIDQTNFLANIVKRTLK